MCVCRSNIPSTRTQLLSPRHAYTLRTLKSWHLLGCIENYFDGELRASPSPRPSSATCVKSTSLCCCSRRAAAAARRRHARCRTSSSPFCSYITPPPAPSTIRLSAAGSRPASVVLLRRSSQHTFIPHMPLQTPPAPLTYLRLLPHSSSDQPARQQGEDLPHRFALTIEHAHSDETKVHKMPS